MNLDYKATIKYCWIIITLIAGNSSTAASPGKKGAPEYTFTVTIDWSAMKPSDSLFLFLEDGFYADSKKNVHSPVWSRNGQTRFVVRTAVKRGRFYISRKTPPGHLSYGSTYNYLPFVKKYNWDAGDDVKLTVIKKNAESKQNNYYPNESYVIFSGKGVQKYRAAESIERAWNAIDINLAHTLDTSYQFRNIYTDKIRAALAEVESYRDRMAPYYYYLYRSNVIADIGASYHYRLQYLFDKKMTDASTEQRERFKQSYFTDEKKLDSLFRTIPDSVAIQSERFVDFLYKKIRFHHYLKSGSNYSKGLYKYIIATYKGDLRDRLLIKALEMDSGTGMAELIFKDSLTTIRNKESRQELQKIAAKMPGYKAYNFSLQDTAGNIVRLDDLKGNVVFIDFWFGNCGACAGYFASTLKPAEEMLRGKSNIKFVSISIDRGKEHWLRGVRSGEFSSDLSINLYTNGEGGDNDVIRYYDLDAYPQFIIIDTEGKLHRFYRDLTSPDISSTEALVKTLSKLAGITD